MAEDNFFVQYVNFENALIVKERKLNSHFEVPIIIIDRGFFIKWTPSAKDTKKLNDIFVEELNKIAKLQPSFGKTL